MTTRPVLSDAEELQNIVNERNMNALYQTFRIAVSKKLMAYQSIVDSSAMPDVTVTSWERAGQNPTMPHPLHATHSSKIYVGRNVACLITAGVRGGPDGEPVPYVDVEPTMWEPRVPPMGVARADP